VPLFGSKSWRALIFKLDTVTVIKLFHSQVSLRIVG
jgi:hypothetical protein